MLISSCVIKVSDISSVYLRRTRMRCRRRASSGFEPPAAAPATSSPSARWRRRAGSYGRSPSACGAQRPQIEQSPTCLHKAFGCLLPVGGWCAPMEEVADSC